MIPLNEVPRIALFLETVSRRVYARGRGRDGRVRLNRDRVSILRNEKVPDAEGAMVTDQCEYT